MTNLFAILIFAVLCGHSCEGLSLTGIHSFKNAILNLRNNMLKVDQFQGYVNQNVKFKAVEVSPSSLLRNLSEVVNKKFAERVDAVKQLHQVVEKTYVEAEQWGLYQNCCQAEDERLIYNSNYGTKVRY